MLALTHHEKWDGTGYPHNLRREDIPLEGRICGLADFFDACTSHRIYRPAMENKKVLTMIKEAKGTHFDPAIVEAFFDVLPEILKTQEIIKTHRRKNQLVRIEGAGALLHLPLPYRFYSALTIFPSASKMVRVPLSTVSGLREILSIPHSTRN